MGDTAILSWNRVQVACNACITSQTADYETYRSFESYFERLTFTCASDKLMLYPVLEDGKTVEAVRAKGLLFEVPFTEISEIGNALSPESGFADSPFRTTAFGILRCEPCYIVLKSGQVLVLEHNENRTTGRFFGEIDSLIKTFNEWKEKQTNPW
uniref:Uncharacterized protein n=1 Tax=Chromera velia CCMP2878 TaxID=1169474 RepID=A0A0G4FPB4_9ALVE|eukprot:Cvel_18070.t1-p1 / transcript=Cvel_18070.t1 / gene=Cvel_18070 / organism=Chromera_velia_CCMP2878 / gene_product=hypothetical protein / transcript_product=hypothetical protein / location=Cvel_scaffold1477:44833-45294(-) / protein_length=154 / sequence_SO=supercontig / SO=protein_coding / is_pseudo=false